MPLSADVEHTVVQRDHPKLQQHHRYHSVVLVSVGQPCVSAATSVSLSSFDGAAECRFVCTTGVPLWALCDSYFDVSWSMLTSTIPEFFTSLTKLT